MKKWWKSKTLWFNAALAVGVAVEASIGVIQASVSPEYYLAIVGLIAGVNVILRFLTTQGVGK